MADYQKCDSAERRQRALHRLRWCLKRGRCFPAFLRFADAVGLFPPSAHNELTHIRLRLAHIRNPVSTLRSGFA